MKFLDKLDRNEWLAARAGLVTGSRIPAIMKGKQTARTQLIEIASEKIFGCEENYVSAAANRGTEYEPYIIGLVEKKFDAAVDHSIAFVENENYVGMGYSPDGLIRYKDSENIEAVVEVKVPLSANFSKRMIEDDFEDYKQQLFFGMLITNADRGILAVAHPESQTLLTKVFHRNEILDDLAKILVQANLAVTTINEMHETILSKLKE